MGEIGLASKQYFENKFQKGLNKLDIHPRGYTSILRGRVGGGLDLTSSLEAKFGARSGRVHQIRGKTWEVLSPQDPKVGKKSKFWGHI